MPSLEADRAAVLFANDAFYTAFSAADMKAMANCWGAGDAVTCLHPGWEPLRGRSNVLASWTAILNNPGSPKVQARDALVHVTGDLAWVVCFEALDGGNLIATNIFRREEGQWKIVHHQAGPTTAKPSGLEPPTHALQ
ncbi:MAG: nuclear transport factor 2 family protein [Rhodospirillales bacterium]